MIKRSTMADLQVALYFVRTVVNVSAVASAPTYLRSHSIAGAWRARYSSELIPLASYRETVLGESNSYQHKRK